MHIPVLKEEVVAYLNPKPNENFVDCTLGAGGHALAILERNGPKGKVLGIDWDPEAIKNFKVQISKSKTRLTLVQGNFAHVKEIVQREKFKPVHGVLIDLGLSSDQLEKSGRGFSFRRNEPLDMRYNPANVLNATKILNFWSKQDIEHILKEYGEEQFADAIAQKIVSERSKTPITKTFQLVELIQRATPAWYARKKIHPATKTFQALRIAVNNELENLQIGLKAAAETLKGGGRLLVISFHSLEDRIVKNFFRQETSFKILTKKPVIASFQEQKENPRSRSAKLRAAVKQS